jgi:hypothetical protein
MLIRLVRILVYAWTFPTTSVGLIFLAPTRLGRVHARAVGGVIEIHGGLASWFLRHATLLEGGASAMTLGHVVIGLDAQALDLTRDHERVHVRQAERLGPFFVPAYLLASFLAWRRGLDPYRDNPFEIEAYNLSS